MRKLFVIAIVILAFMGLMSAGKKDGSESADAPAAAVEAPPQSPDSLLQAVRSSVHTSPKWADIDGELDGSGGYRLGINYASAPSGHAEVARDTKAVAQAALNALVASGRNPSKEMLFLSVWGRKPERGATGQSLVRLYGKSIYNFNNDSIEYKPYN